MSTDTPEANDIYSQRLLALADNLDRTERLPDPDATAWGRSRHEVKACKLGTASAAVMARHVVGSAAGELRELRQTMRAMLKDNGPPPTGRWVDLEVLAPARKIRSRHPSIMLTFDAVTKAIDEIESRRDTPAPSGR